MVIHRLSRLGGSFCLLGVSDLALSLDGIPTIINGASCTLSCVLAQFSSLAVAFLVQATHAIYENRTRFGQSSNFRIL